MQQMKQGDFTELAENYSKYRPDYSSTILDAILSLLPRSVTECDAVDVGAGTGIWTRMLAEHPFKSVTAVEPNGNMRENGIKDSNQTKINWLEGSGEQTNLADNSMDFLSMASSFHWVDFDKGIREFHRVLRPNGLFVAIWNPRLIDANPVLKQIENYVYEINPNIKRVSSGKSDFVNELTQKLTETSLFKDLIYMEGCHDLNFSKEQYMGVWRSVNDIRAQLGEAGFETFLKKTEAAIQPLDQITCRYMTRAWIVKCNKD